MRPTLVANPVSDRVFQAFAEQQLDEGVEELAVFQMRLRVRYPQAIVHARDLTGEPTAVWYVYRDGQWTNPRESGS